MTTERSFSEPVEHHINITGSHIFCEVHTLRPQKFAVIRKEKNVLRRVFVNLQIVVGLREFTWSLNPMVNSDYRRLNVQRIPDWYPFPIIHDFAQSITDCRIFLFLDLVQAYHQIPVASEDEFTGMTFGLCNTVESYIHSMLWNFFSSYICMIFLFFHPLLKADLVLNVEKCKF